MTASPSDLIERLRSADFNERAKAFAALVGQGRSAAPALVRVLEEPDDLVRTQAARALSEIADPGTADALAAATNDGNANVRAHAAAGLARIGDERAVEAMVRTIDDLPDLMHHPYTSSVYGLIDLGRPSLPAVAPLLSADDPMTRLRAFVVVRSVVSALEEGSDWNALWDSLGRYDPDAERAEREAAAELWTDWIRDHS
jgi:HEAT repeat protein